MSSAGTPQQQFGTGRRNRGRASLRSRSVMLIRFVPVFCLRARGAAETNGRLFMHVRVDGRAVVCAQRKLREQSAQHTYLRYICCDPLLPD